jgi:hypothetical protein
MGEVRTYTAGADVMITIFRDFYQLSAKIGVSLENQFRDNFFLLKLAAF